MPFYGTIEALLEYVPHALDYLAVRQTARQENDMGGLEGLLSEKIRSLRTILDQITLEIVERDNLSKNVINHIYQHYSYFKTRLLELYVWPLSSNRAIEFRRTTLEKQLDALKQEKRSEQVQSSQDIALLNSEFRKWFKQFSDITQRSKLVLDAEKHINRNHR